MNEHTEDGRGDEKLHQLYRHWDKDGNLLYVGISLSAVGRLADHRKSARWYTEIVNVTIENFPSEKLLRAAEKNAVVTEKPRYNIVYAPKEQRYTKTDDLPIPEDELYLELRRQDVDDDFHVEITDMITIDHDQRERLAIGPFCNDDDTKEWKELFAEQIEFEDSRYEQAALAGVLLFNKEFGEGAACMISPISHTKMSEMMELDLLRDYIHDLTTTYNEKLRKSDLMDSRNKRRKSAA